MGGASGGGGGGAREGGPRAASGPPPRGQHHVVGEQQAPRNLLILLAVMEASGQVVAQLQALDHPLARALARACEPARASRRHYISTQILVEFCVFNYGSTNQTLRNIHRI